MLMNCSAPTSKCHPLSMTLPSPCFTAQVGGCLGSRLQNFYYCQIRKVVPLVFLVRVVHGQKKKNTRACISLTHSLSLCLLSYCPQSFPGASTTLCFPFQCAPWTHHFPCLFPLTEKLRVWCGASKNVRRDWLRRGSVKCLSSCNDCPPPLSTELSHPITLQSRDPTFLSLWTSCFSFKTSFPPSNSLLFYLI